MSPPKLPKFLIVTTKPCLEDYPENLDAYILVQPKAMEAPTELYYLSTDSELLALITQDNIDALLAKIQSPVIHFDYSGIKEINHEQKQLIEDETHFSIDNAVSNVHLEIDANEVVKNRVQSGILAQNTGKPIRLKEHSCLILHCNLFSDGNGDAGNAIDVAKHLIEYIKDDSIHFYFVVTATQAVMSNEDPFDKCYKHFLNEVTNLFNKYPKMSFNIEENVYSFRMNNLPTELLRGLNAQSPDYNALVNTNQKLKEIYNNADAIFNIATPFPALPISVQLKPSAQIINITEHNASSLWFSPRSIPQVHHYVTGIGKDKSGMMVEELSCNLEKSVMALQAIEKEYIHKLGLNFPLSTKDAAQFLKNTLVVPVYLGEMQKNILAPLIYMISQSPLASRFGNIVFHINQRCYEDEIFDKQFKALENSYGSGRDKIQLIVGHFFKDETDLRRLYQLSSGTGLAIISSDKVLELAISSGLFPIYPPVPWKQDVYRDICKLGKDSPDYIRLVSGLESIENQQIPDMASLITPDLIEFWANSIRPDLLKNSFYGILQTRIMGKNILEEKISTNITVGPGLFSQKPMELIVSQAQNKFSTQLSFVTIKPDQTLQFIAKGLANKEFGKILQNCDAQLSPSKHLIEIRGPKNIQQFLIDLGFKGSMLQTLCRELKLDFQKPTNTNESSCSLM